MKRAVLIAASLSLVLAACGLKVPVTVVAGSGEDAGGQPLVSSSTGPVATDGPASVSGPGGVAPTTGTGAGGTGAVPSELKKLFKNDTEGVSNSQLTLCTHVPITGAAPITHHWERFGQFYFNYVNATMGGVYGRRIRFLAFDDRYYPAGARDAAEKCARQGAFLYLGAAGTDQIVSVAKWAEKRQVPYFHGPTSVKDLGGFSYNIHGGPSYEYQHELLAKYLVDRYGKDKVYGMVRVNSPYFNAGHDAFIAALKKEGVTLRAENDKVVEKDEQQFTTIINDFKRNGVDVVNNFTTPNIWLRMLPQSKAADFTPVWTAVSPIAGYNIVAPVISGAGTAVVFQHFNPACDCTDFTKDVPANHPFKKDIDEFLRIFRQYSPEQKPEPDDFDYAAYLTAKALHRLLLKLGPAPTRSGLWALLQGQKYAESTKAASPGCPLDFTRNNQRMGAWSVNVFELKVGRWRQIETCQDRF